MSEPTDRLKEVRQHLTERAKANRARSERERTRRNHVLQREQLKREVRDCGELVQRCRDGLLPLWPDFKGNWALAAEACGEGERNGERWNEINRMTCKVWVRRWRRVAWLMRQKGLMAVALDAQPDEPVERLTHGLFIQLVRATDWREMQAAGRSVAVELASVRSELARMASPELPDVHFELGEYFKRWLLPRIDAELHVRTPRDTSDSDPRFNNARLSLEWALSIRPDLEGDFGRVYEYIKSSGECPTYSGCRLPRFDTWKRYARQPGRGARR